MYDVLSFIRNSTHILTRRFRLASGMTGRLFKSTLIFFTGFGINPGLN